MINGKLVDAIHALYTDSLISVQVPEWAEFIEDGLVYFKPTTMQDLQRIEGQKVGEGDLNLVLYKALDAQGNNLFDTGARDLLRTEVAAHVIQRIAAAMCEVPEVNALKKS